MTSSAMTALLGPEFDTFLFAAVGEEEKGGLLSVLSALAQSDVDPWEEAAELARLPREAASRRLTSLLAALPEAPRTRLAASAISDRLLKLLPCSDPPSLTKRMGLPNGDRTPRSRTIAYVVLINLLFAAGMLGAQFALASFRPPNVSTHASATRTTLADKAP